MNKRKLIIFIGLLLSNAASYADQNNQTEVLQAKMASNPIVMAAMLINLAKNMSKIMIEASKDGKLVDTVKKFISLELLAEQCLKNQNLEEEKCEILKKALNLFKKAYSLSMEELDKKQKIDESIVNHECAEEKQRDFKIQMELF